MRELLNIAPEVANALQEQRAVVALESTVIAHGLPRPQNLQTAQRLEAVVREGGAVPATIAILDGKLSAGLGKFSAPSNSGIETNDPSIAKRRPW